MKIIINGNKIDYTAPEISDTLVTFYAFGIDATDPRKPQPSITYNDGSGDKIMEQGQSIKVKTGLEFKATL